MSIDQEEVKRNLLSPETWLRVLLMAGFAVAAWLTTFVLMVVIPVQVVLVLITGAPNANLRHFGLTATAYLSQTLQFLLYSTEHKPFPFAPFPDPSGAPRPNGPSQ
ncbi:MAG: DUF4389 domain-containing protein [Pseudomonadales bacterium]|jgi:hypothetical protein|nr:DUF4389 domain-containing protein [Pseudomonadales bacterium]